METDEGYRRVAEATLVIEPFSIGLQRDLLRDADLHESIAKMVPTGTSISIGVNGGPLTPVDVDAHRAHAKRLRKEAQAH